MSAPRAVEFATEPATRHTTQRFCQYLFIDASALHADANGDRKAMLKFSQKQVGERPLSDHLRIDRVKLRPTPLPKKNDKLGFSLNYLFVLHPHLVFRQDQRQ